MLALDSATGDCALMRILVSMDQSSHLRKCTLVVIKDSCPVALETNGVRFSEVGALECLKASQIILSIQCSQGQGSLIFSCPFLQLEVNI